VIKKLSIIRTIFVFILVTAFFQLGLQSTPAQSNPLTLGKILTGLQAKSGGFSISEKNEFITKEVLKRGITFNLSGDIETELKLVGANSALINAIRVKSKTTTRPVNNTKPPSVKPERVWVVQNANLKGVKGLEVHARFNVYNLKGKQSQVTVRFQNSARNFLLSSVAGYRNKLGHLARFRPITPKFTATVYNDLSFFVPYKEIGLTPGPHRLNAKLDLIRNGRLVQSIDSYPFTLNLPTPASYKPRVKYSRLSVDYNKRIEGQLGMTIKTTFTVTNFKNGTAQVRISFYDKAGKRLGNPNSKSKYRTTKGNLAIFKNLKPAYASAVYKNYEMFIPYKEFGLLPGRHNLKLRADLIYPDGTLMLHFTEKKFRFTQR